MEKKIPTLLLIVVLMSNVLALQTLGTFQVDTTINLIQGCDASTYSNISKIIYPNSSFALDAETIMGNTTIDNYNYSFSDTSLIGQYLVYGHCDEDGTDTEWVYDFWVTTTGDRVNLSNTILVVVFLILAGVFLVLGFSFSKEHWLLKTFFNFCSVGMGILAVNSAKIIASESNNLGTMGTTGLTLMIVVFAIFFIYIFIYSFIEVIKALKEKRGVRWNYD